MNYQQLTEQMLAGEQKRSTPFKQGMAAVLQNRVDLTSVNSPYSHGTADDDAFFAGRMRGHNEFKNLLDEVDQNFGAAVARLESFAEAGRRVA